jgi:hypothetical protein
MNEVILCRFLILLPTLSDTECKVWWLGGGGFAKPHSGYEVKLSISWKALYEVFTYAFKYKISLVFNVLTYP